MGLFFFFFPRGDFHRGQIPLPLLLFPSLSLPVFTVQSLPAAGLKNESLRFLGVGMEVVKKSVLQKKDGSANFGRRAS